MKQNTRSTPADFLTWPLFAIIASFILILARILPMGGPFVFSDEYTYAAWASALHRGLGSPPQFVPALSNWLYLHLYQLAYVGSGAFLVKARVLNALISSLAAGLLVPIFQIFDARKNLVLAISLAIGFSVALGGTYAAYFMPDAAYYSAVCLVLFCIWKFSSSPSYLTAVALGIAGGIATMTKAHGLLLLPSSLVVVVLTARFMNLGLIRSGLIATTTIITWISCTSTITAVLGHGIIFNPLGEFYTSVGTHAADHAESIGLISVFQVALHHIATLALIEGLPLIVCFTTAAQTLFRPINLKRWPLQSLAIFLGSALLGMILVTAVFTVGVAGLSVTETMTRLHGRYYEHIALLASFIGIIEGGRLLGHWTWRARLALGIAFISTLAFSLAILHGVGWQNPNDFASAYGLFSAPDGRYYAVSITFAAGLAALVWPRHASTAMSAGLLLWLGLNVTKTDQLRWNIPEAASGKVAAAIAHLEEGNHKAKVEIIASGMTVPVYRAAFHLLPENVSITVDPNSVKCSVSESSFDWVITIGDAENFCGLSETFQVGDVEAYRTQQNLRKAHVARQQSVESIPNPPSTRPPYKARLSLQGEPRISNDGKNFVVHVNVENTGSTTFGSDTTPNNVNLGAHSVDAAGKIIDNDLARGHIPQIPPGTQAAVTILLPISKILNNRVQLLPVVENVAWFDSWGTIPLTIGPFISCGPITSPKVCDGAGDVLPGQ